MNDGVMNVLAVLGVGCIFVVGVLIGGSIIVKGVWNIIKSIFGIGKWGLRNADWSHFNNCRTATYNNGQKGQR